MKHEEKANSKKMTISKKTFVALVNKSLKGKELFKDKVEYAKKLLKESKSFNPVNSK